jgi:hypothetical protein
MKIIGRKLGKIFDPRQFELPERCQEFAQSPQALVFDDFVRIYFSTRRSDPAERKYLSYVAFVDVDKDLSNIRSVSKKTVIGLGNRGTFDEHGIFPISPLRVNGAIRAYTCGWSRRISVSVETSIGLAVSNDDGQTFERIGDGPVLTSSLHEPMLVGDGFVRVFDGTFHMWYIFGTRWKKAEGAEPPARVYKIAHAESKNGINWQTKEGQQIVADRLNEDECQALPTVIQINGRWHMFFCYRHATDFRTNPSRSYRIGYAYSDDLKNWTRDDSNAGIDVSDDGWDSEMLCYPNVFECEGKVFLLYNGNEFGRFGFGAGELEIGAAGGPK